MRVQASTRRLLSRRSIPIPYAAGGPFSLLETVSATFLRCQIGPNNDSNDG
jgi:hypothetical protein